LKKQTTTFLLVIRLKEYKNNSIMDISNFLTYATYGWEENVDEDNSYYCYFYDVPVDVDKYFKFKSNEFDIRNEEEQRILKILSDNEKCEYKTDYDSDFGYMCIFFNPQSDDKLSFSLTYDNGNITLSFKFKDSEFNEEKFNSIALKYYNLIVSIKN
jgi:hypothetical protein